MLFRALSPCVLLSLCVVVHALAMTGLLRHLSRFSGKSVLRFWTSTWVLIRMALWIVMVHLFEIGMWAFFLTWQRVFPDLRTSFYFSAVTYATTGYGDLVLPDNWRLVAAVEGLTGILMCGWSTGVFFAVVSRMYSDYAAKMMGIGKSAGH